MIDRATLRVMGLRQTVAQEILGVQHRLNLLLGHDQHAKERAHLMVEMSRLMKLRVKLDNDYTHWDDIDDNGYDKDDPDDFNYPPPSPPPPSLALYA